jgi:A/G-specific adenine glycosylase
MCYAHQQNMVEKLPVKRKNNKKRLRYFYYLKIHQNGHLFMQKRAENDIWNSLYQFPLIESNKAMDLNDITASDQWKKIFNGVNPTINSVSNTYNHLLTHQKIHAQFFEIEIPHPTDFLLKNYITLESGKIQEIAVPRLIEKYLEEKNNKK